MCIVLDKNKKRTEDEALEEKNMDVDWEEFEDE